jgi:hypothetical protein
MSVSQAAEGDAAFAGIVEIVQVYEEAEEDAAEDDGAEDNERLIGTLEIQRNGRLLVVEADAAREDFLHAVVDRMNEKRSVSLISTEAGEAPFTTRSVSVGREEPGFVEALRRYLHTYYGLRLG